MKKRKSLGQHFLRDDTVAADVARAVLPDPEYDRVVEVGPGGGRLTQHLLAQFGDRLYVVELDERWVASLQQQWPALAPRILSMDILQWQPEIDWAGHSFVLIGNFPYYISTEILFFALRHKAQIPQVIGMFQKEVADRVAAPPGNRQYGVTSVLLTAFYDAEVLFDVPPHLFSPPPRVTSAVLRLVRRPVPRIVAPYGEYRKVVKAAFNQRRKTLRNALKGILPEGIQLPERYAGLRAEALSVEDFDELTLWLQA